MTRSACSSSTACWTRLRRSSTDIASGCSPPDVTGWSSSSETNRASAWSRMRRGRWQGQLEGAVQSDAVTGRGQVEQPGRDRGSRVPRAARDRVWSASPQSRDDGATPPRSSWDKARATSAQGLDGAKRVGGEACRPRKLAEGQALEQDRRTKAPPERRRRVAARPHAQGPALSHRPWTALRLVAGAGFEPATFGL